MDLKLIGFQGDLVVFETTEFPKGERIDDKQTKDKTLAYGELSGHAHAFAEPENVDVFKMKEYPGLCFVDPLKEVNLEHGRIKGWTGEEVDTWYHKPVQFQPGRKYITGIVEETDWISKNIRKVVD